jgi:tetratricopeptide (TPR) repeat protein
MKKLIDFLYNLPSCHAELVSASLKIKRRTLNILKILKQVQDDKIIKNLSYTKILILILFFAGNLFAANEYFQKANKLYEAKEYSQAIDIYQKLVDQGLSSKELFFNLSNAYYKNNQIGYAVLFNEKAYRLAPRDEDICYNRQLLGKIYDKKFFSFNELMTAFTVLWGLFFLFLTVSLYFKNRKLFWSKVVIFVLLFVNFAWLIFYYYTDFKFPKAIVVKHEAVVYTGPAEDSQAIFTLPEAAQVLIENKKDGWLNVYVEEQGLKGWSKKENVEKI